MRRRRILFICHSASRNGASILLLNLLRWLRANTTFDVEVLVAGTGALVKDLEETCRTRVIRAPGRLLVPGNSRLLQKITTAVDGLCIDAALAGKHYDLAYVNTVSCAKWIPAVTLHSNRVMWHIHELTYAIELATGMSRFADLASLVSRFVVVSKTVSDILISDIGVNPERLDIVHGFVPICTSNGEGRSDIRRRLRHELGFPLDSFVIGGCGSLGWRKGSDIFVQVARAICSGKRELNCRFIWIGGEKESDEGLRFKYDLRALGLSDRCIHVPSTKDVSDYYHVMDAFALTSREDPFPLVMLEAGARCVPTVCFEGGGGGPEFVAGDVGLTASYLDIEQFVARLLSLVCNPEWARSLGTLAAQRVRLAYSIESQGPKLLESIERCLRSN